MILLFFFVWPALGGGNSLIPEGECMQGCDATFWVGPVWQWVETVYTDGKQTVPSEPKRYTLQFLEKGDLHVRADCNRKGGRYSVEGNRLSLEMNRSTMAACGEGSLEGQFVKELSAGTSFFLKGGGLYIELKLDSGIMTFKRQNRP